jgi:hypothetical protein
MRAALLVVLLCAHLARAADDAPLEPVLVPQAQRIAEGKAMASCLAERDALKTGNVIVSVPAFVAVLVGVAAASVAVTVGVAAATAPKH